MLCILFAVGLLPLSAFAQEDMYQTAKPVSFGKTYTGNLTSSHTYEYYKIELKESGRLTIAVSIDIELYYYSLMDENRNTIAWNSLCRECGYSGYLTAGVYYFYLEASDPNFGVYQLKATFESSEESFREAQNALLNDKLTAPQINTGKSFRGQLAANDQLDLYKLELRNTRSVTIRWDDCDRNTDRDNDFKYSLCNYKQETQRSKSNTYRRFDYDLPAGVYYFEVDPGDINTGSYSFMIYTPGDPDNDGVLTSADARLVLRMAVGLDSVGEESPLFAAADYNENGMVQADDARCILRAAVGLEP